MRSRVVVLSDKDMALICDVLSQAPGVDLTKRNKIKHYLIYRAEMNPISNLTNKWTVGSRVSRKAMVYRISAEGLAV